MFKLSQTPILPQELVTQLHSPQAGAICSFEGWIRNHNHGKEVLYLEYDVYPALAISEMEKIIKEAKQLFKIIDCKAVHRYGKLEIGDIAVWIGVISVHRKESFLACEYLINELKARVPIWKKEHYAHEQAMWVQCNHR